mgnify:CR=1 FL=1
MMDFNFNELMEKQRRFVIMGGNLSGKTHLSKYILKIWGNKGIAIDVVNQYKGINRYTMNIKNGSPEGRKEVDIAIGRLAISQKWENNHKFKALLIDEANKYFPTNIPLLNNASALNNEYRHYIDTFGLITRRPARLFNDFVDLADVLFIFILEGKNDKKYLNDVYDGLGDMVAGLQEYHFVVKVRGQAPFIHEPIKLE